MSTPLAVDPVPRTFDLSSEASYVRRQTLGFRLAAAGIGVVIVGIALLLALSNPAQALVTLPLLVFGGLFLLLAVAARSDVPPTELTIRPGGLGVRYADGERRALAWTDAALAFRVIDRAGDDTATHDERAHLAIEFADGHVGTIPKSVLLALDDAAVEYRVPRLARRETWKQGRKMVVRRVIRFGEPARTPHWTDVQEVRPG